MEYTLSAIVLALTSYKYKINLIFIKFHIKTAFPLIHPSAQYEKP
jgi:hypothetical protein